MTDPQDHDREVTTRHGPGDDGERHDTPADNDTAVITAAEPTPVRPHRWAALAGFAAVTTATAVGGALVGPSRPSTMTWYRSLEKPPFQPPASVFGPVWTGLYATIAYSGWRVWQAPSSPVRTRALALWGVQMAANAAWTPLFFGARKTRLALADLTVQLAATVGYTATAARVDRPAAATMAPYLGWTSFAGALNTEIVRRND